MSDLIAEIKGRSRLYKVVLLISFVIAGLRLTLHGVYLNVLLYPDRNLIDATPFSDEALDDSMLPVDMQIYFDAAHRLQNRQELYLSADVIEVYQYPPAYAAAFVPFLYFSPLGIVSFHTVLHIVAYVGLFSMWYRIFNGLGRIQARDKLITILPIWLVFTGFWSDLSYLNIYLIVAMLSTLLIESVIYERLGASMLWLTIILHIKPHWAFAAGVPLLLGRYRFFLKMVAFSAIAYIIVVVGLMIFIGPNYVRQQYIDYVRFLGTLSREFPWRGPDDPFLGYNHSIKQIGTYLFGVSSAVLQLANFGKSLLLLPLVGACFRHLIHPVKQAGYKVPTLSLNLGFALYLGAFIWMDMVWEVSLGIVILPYLLAEMDLLTFRILSWVVFLPYALIDLWQAVSFIIWGEDIIAPGAYILTDPSLYVPLVMGVILTFYALLIRQLYLLSDMTDLQTQ